ncbi:MAG TPA: hypothetical protein PLX89_02770 [Verrucomicrobiota bacterium]|nr:hypothetical protein [Verrucomicrobiota bacterium]
MVGAQTTWDCGGEGEVPCSSQTDFFWENGNLFADRGLIATGFRVLPPIKFAGNEWVDFNRVDMSHAVDLINNRIPALRSRLQQLGSGDFLKSVCAGVERDGQCWLVPPSTGPGILVFDECIPTVDWDLATCTIDYPGVPSTDFDWVPDFGASGWSVVDDMTGFLRASADVLGRFPAVVRGIPGPVPTLNFPRPSAGTVMNLSSFQASVNSLKNFFTEKAAFFNVFTDLVHDFTDPPATARCVNDTRHQAVPADFQGTWAYWAFRNQEELAKDEPFNWASRVATHNGFNNRADGYLAPNQEWSLTDQLNLGSRGMSLDLHWFAGKLRLSHGQADHSGAGDRDRFYANGIKEIAQWLRTHPREFIVISFEDRSEDHHAEVTEPLERYLGDLIYRTGDAHRPWCDGRIDLASQWPSLQELRDLGKQVLVFGGNAHESDLIWTGIPGPSFSSARTSAFQPDPTNWIAYSHAEKIGPFATVEIGSQFEGRSLLDPFDPAGFLTFSRVAERVRYSISEISLDQIQAQERTAQCPDAGLEVCSAPDRRIEALVWSWLPGQPEDVLTAEDNGEDVAVLNGDLGGWESRRPGEIHYFACARLRGLDPLELPDRLGQEWRITERAGPWWEGQAACDELNRTLRSNGRDDDDDGIVDEPDEGDFVFSAPVNGRQNQMLLEVLRLFRRTHPLPEADPWLAVHDQLQHGHWQLSRSFPAGWNRTRVLRFDGVGDVVRVPEFGAAVPNDEITVEFWQKVNQAKPQATFSLIGANEALRTQAHVPWADGQVYWDFGNVSDGGRLAYRPPVDLTGTWQHFAFVASRRGNYMKIFRNGVEEATKVGMSSLPRQAADLFLGSGTVAGSPDAFFGGELDEFRIWNVARTETEIRQGLRRRVTGAEPGLVASWPLETEDGNRVSDVTGAHPGTRVRSPQWVEYDSGGTQSWAARIADYEPFLYLPLDEPIKATRATDASPRKFHGSYVGVEPGQPSASPVFRTGVRFLDGNSCIRLGNLGCQRQFTLFAWLNLKSMGQLQVLYGGSGQEAGALKVALATDGLIGVEIAGNEPSLVTFPYAYPNGPGWHQLALSYDADVAGDQIRLAIDGRELGTATLAKAGAVWFNAGCLGNSPAGGQALDGMLDEFVLLSTALSAEETRELYLLGVGRPVSGTVTGPLGPAVGVGVEFRAGTGLLSLSEATFSGAPIHAEWVSNLGWAPGTSRFYAGGPTNEFAAEFTGQLVLNSLVAADVEFVLGSSDGSRLSIDGVLALNNDGVHPHHEVRANVRLGIGSHEFKVQYFSASGRPSLQLNTGPEVFVFPLIEARYFSASGPRLGFTRTDGSGRYEFSHVPAGAILSAVQQGWTFAPEQVERPETDTPVHFVVAESPPSISAVADPAPGFPGETVRVFFSVSDLQTPAEALSVAVSSDNQTLLPQDRIRLGGSGGRRYVDCSTVENLTGSGRIQLTVTDQSGASATTSFTVTARADGVVGEVRNDLGGIADVLVEAGRSSELELVFEIPLNTPPLYEATLGEINQSTAFGPFFPGGPLEFFGAEYRAELEVRPGILPSLPVEVSFALSSDDGARLFVDGQEVLNGDGRHFEQRVSVVRVMAPGIYDVRVLYFNSTGPGVVRLEVGDHGRLRSPVTARYWDTRFRKLAETRTDAQGRFAFIGLPSRITVRPIEPHWTFAPPSLAVSPPAQGLSFILDESPPVLSAILDPVPFARLESREVSFRVFDQQTTPERLRLSATSSNPNLFPVENMTFAGKGEERTLAMKPRSLDPGFSVVTVFLEDEAGLKASQSFSIEMSPPAPPPPLQVSLEAGHWLLAWPAGSTGSILEQAAALVPDDGTIWQEVLDSIQTDGNWNWLDLELETLGDPQRYFRLRPGP